DDNCDGSVDEGHPTGGDACVVVGVFGVCAAGRTSCETGPMVCSQVTMPTQEVCDGRDNDCDGVVDNGYAFGGYQQPINADGTSIFKKGSTVPVKFRLSRCNGTPVSTAVARIHLFLYSMGIVGTEVEDVTSPGQANTDDLFRASPDGQYVYNLSTKALAARASYVVRTTLDDGSHYDVVISLK
ncbi:MAG TPA: PxKF domain-containing protein, partial [Dongiaceae bacterium]|nr:PxKF domain-containing protein [Dongiaceae bacterium]